MSDAASFLRTNVVIDLLARREPFYKEAQVLFTLADRGQLQLQISALSFAFATYALAKHYPVADAKKYLQQFKVLVTILPLNDKAIELALASEFLMNNQLQNWAVFSPYYLHKIWNELRNFNRLTYFSPKICTFNLWKKDCV